MFDPARHVLFEFLWRDPEPLGRLRELRPAPQLTEQQREVGSEARHQRSRGHGADIVGDACLCIVEPAEAGFQVREWYERADRFQPLFCALDVTRLEVDGEPFVQLTSWNSCSVYRITVIGADGYAPMVLPIRQ